MRGLRLPRPQSRRVRPPPRRGEGRAAQRLANILSIALTYWRISAPYLPAILGVILGRKPAKKARIAGRVSLNLLKWKHFITYSKSGLGQPNGGSNPSLSAIDSGL